MDTSPASKFLLFVLFILTACSLGLVRQSQSATYCDKKQSKREQYQQTHHSFRRELSTKPIQHDLIDPYTAPFPTTPVTNPVTAPDTSTPAIITIPSANPGGAPFTVPPTNPGGGLQPVTDPVTTYPPGAETVPSTNPVVGPPEATANGPPAVPGQSWCVARGGASENALQAALDYACGIGGSAIQEGESCYNPNSLKNHASYAFNTYYQKNPVQTSCDFGGNAVVTNTNPSSGSCTYTTWSPNSGSPITAAPTTASSTGTTPASGSGSPPGFSNVNNNPTMGGATTTGFGDSPETANAPSISMSSGLRPFTGCMLALTTVVTGRILFDV